MQISPKYRADCPSRRSGGRRPRDAATRRRVTGQLAALGLGDARSTTASCAGAAPDRPRCVRGRPPRSRARRAAGWPRCSPPARAPVLSHRSAAALWGVRDGDRRRSTSSRRITPPQGDRHPPRRAAADEVTTERGVPVTTPARTLFDLAGVLTRQQLEAAITEAEVRRLASPTSLADLVARYPGRRGIATLRRILGDTGRIGRTLTRSELEIAFLALVDAHGLPRPRPQPHRRPRRARRHLARRPPRRRARRLRDPRHPPRLRGRPCPGPRAHARRLARRPPHRPPADERGRDHRATAPDPPGGYRVRMPEAVIVDAVRTPIGRAGQGLAQGRPRRRPRRRSRSGPSSSATRTSTSPRRTT